jgi:hypothetical protein
MIMFDIALRRFACVLCFVTILAAAPAVAEHQKVVGGLIVNIGLVAAGKLQSYPAEVGAHGAAALPGQQHLLVSLSDAKSGAHVEPVAVTVEVTDPKGKARAKQLKRGQTGDFPDFSELFDFGRSGKYRIRVIVSTRDGRQVRADFVHNQAV